MFSAEEIPAMFDVYNETNERYFLRKISIENFPKNNFCIFDLEGTGLDRTNDSITQIGAVRIINGKLDEKVFCEYVRPEKRIPHPIEKLTGITNEMVKEKYSFDQVYPSFEEYAKGCILVAQCGYEYDYHMLNAACQRYGISRNSSVELDTKIIFSFLHPEINETISTDFLVQYYNIDVSNLTRHNALTDSIIIARALTQMLNEFTINISKLDIDEGRVIKKFIPKPLN